MAADRYSGGGDTADLTLDAAGAIGEQTVGLPGGSSVTRRVGSTEVWSHPNLHGDVAATTGPNGAKIGATFTYDPYGNPLGTLPDNSAGAMDHAWLGQHQRPLEHQAGLIPIIEMGARQYDPTLGRFLEVDPIEGGSCNDYEYVCAEPISKFDLDGTRMCVDRDCRNSIVWSKKSRSRIVARPTARCRSNSRDPGCYPGLSRMLKPARSINKSNLFGGGRVYGVHYTLATQSNPRSAPPKPPRTCGAFQRGIASALLLAIGPTRLGTGKSMPLSVPGQPSLFGYLCPSTAEFEGPMA